MKVQEFIGKSCNSLVFIICNRNDFFGLDPIYISDTSGAYMDMPEKISNLEVSRYTFKEVKGNIAYIIVNTYGEDSISKQTTIERIIREELERLTTYRIPNSKTDLVTLRSVKRVLNLVFRGNRDLELNIEED